MSKLHLTEPFEDSQKVCLFISLRDQLERSPEGTCFTSWVGHAEACVFDSLQTEPTKFLFIDGIYYFGLGGPDWLDNIEVGDYAEVVLRDCKLHVDTASYPMVAFDLGRFIAAAGNLDAALAGLPHKRAFETGVVSYTIDKAGPNGGTRILVYDIPDGAPPEAFAPHLHNHGEVFYVVAGRVRDEHGFYDPGRMVVAGPNTFHRPTAEGRTVIVVCWTGGITNPP